MLLTIGTICDYILLSTPRNLERREGRERLIEENKGHPFSHYMICESDRLRIDPESIVHDHEKISFTLKQQISEFKWQDHQIEMPAVLSGTAIHMSVEGPNISITAPGHDALTFDSTFLFLEMLASGIGASDSIAEVLKLTVMYVGQTEITDSYIRFDGHEKLNSVYGDVVAVRPHREVWVKLLSFQNPFTTMLSVPEIESSFRKDWLPGGGLLENLPADQMTNAIEGVLIKYFQPELNVQLKKNFPSDRHTSYKYFYENNIRSIFVELHEEFRSYVTGNKTTPYTRVTMIEFALSSDDKGPYLHDNSRQYVDAMLRKKE